MFSLGNWIVLAALGSGGQEPFLERLVTGREVPCSALSAAGKMCILLLVTRSLPYSLPLQYSAIYIY